MLRMAKIYSELFTLKLNGIVVSAQHMSCPYIVLHDILDVGSRQMRIGELMVNAEERRQQCFFQSGTHDHPVASLERN